MKLKWIRLQDKQPNEGEEILYADMDWVCRGIYKDGRCEGDNADLYNTPTHWMSMPVKKIYIRKEVNSKNVLRPLYFFAGLVCGMGVFALIS